jgi:phosphoserine aminotransferase
LPQKGEVLKKIDSDSVYVHITDNNTICGTKTYDIFETSVPIIADMTSSILTAKIDVSKYAMIYASFQKNLGAAGTAVIIIRDDFLQTAAENIPDLYSYKALLKEDSIYNTPATFNIYTAYLVLKWVKSVGGVSAIESMCQKKSALIYDIIDKSNGFYVNKIKPSQRSTTNVVFNLSSTENEAAFLKFAETKNLVSLK